MRGRMIAGWAMAAALAVAAFSALAQQDEGPILRPKKPVVVKPTGPTLLVLCDLACNWKLDGKEQGRIDAGGSAKAKVELGQHMVVAATEDGADQIKQLVKVEEKGQTVISIELKPVRDSRLRGEQQARNHTEPPVPAKPAEIEPPAPAKPAEKVVPEAAPLSPQERAKIARDEAAGVWTDPATGLMWAKKDNGDYVTRQQAEEYCHTLQLAGHTDWRLPRIEELQGISNKSGSESMLDPESIKHSLGKVFSRHGEKIPPIKGDLQLSSSWAWSSSMGNSASESWDFYFANGKRYSYSSNSRDGSALCVRGSKGASK